MRTILPALGLALALATSVAYAQTPTWTGGAQTVNPTPTNDTGAVGIGLDVDAAGNQYVAGALRNGTGSGAAAVRSFGSTTLSSGAGFSSGFVAKLSATQQWVWAVRATSNAEGVNFTEVTTSPAGDTYAAGVAEADPFSGGGPTVTVGTFTYTSAAPSALIVTRLNANGQPQWLSGATNASARAIKWDAVAGNIIVAGSYSNTATFGSTTLAAAPAGGLFVARLSATGQWLSAVGVPLTGTATTRTLTVGGAAVGPLGQVVFTGRMLDGSATFGATTLTAANGAKIFVAQLGATGTWQWAVSSTGTPATVGVDVAYAPGGEVLVIGNATNGASLGSTAITGTGYPFVARLSATGTWGQVTAAPANDVALRYVASDGVGNAVVLAQLSGATSYTFGSQTVSATGDRTAVARLSPAGVWQYAVASPAIGAGTAASNFYQLTSPVLDAAGNLYVTGAFRGGPLVLGNSSLTGSLYNNSTASTFGGDALVAKLGSAGVVSGVRQAANAPLLALFPNPASGVAATLRLAAPTAAVLPVVLRDALGRAVARTSVPAGRQEVAVATAGLAPGLYMLEAGASRAQLIIE